MSSYSWVKLYHEVLHDPKMGRLTDNLWRRVIEVILLAGECGNDGLLPGALDMAWTLRLSVEALEADLLQLAKYDIVEQAPQGWKVVHFSNRQAPIEAKDRVSAYRDRIQKHDYYATETTEKQGSNEDVTTRNTDKSKSKNKIQSKNREENAADAALPRAVQAYIDAGGKFNTGTLADGTTKKANAYRVITETVTDDDDSIAFWRRVVEAYCAQWSSKSYTIMLSEYYSQGRVPGQPKSNNGNGNGQHAPQSNALAALERMKERHNGDK